MLTSSNDTGSSIQPDDLCLTCPHPLLGCAAVRLFLTVTPILKRWNMDHSLSGMKQVCGAQKGPMTFSREELMCVQLENQVPSDALLRWFTE